MHIYFSGVGGVAIGPLCEIALDAGYTVSGSDVSESLMTQQLAQRGVNYAMNQDGSHIAAVHEKSPIDWFVHTAALPEDHPELVFAREHGIRTSKRDELLAEIIAAKGLKLIAVSGTHGKTSTTGLLVWTMKQLGFKLGYSVGTTLSFGPSGQLEEGSEYFVYECDEFDRNMLHFSPHLTLITSLDHDHFDTYPTADDYRQAFVQFIEQSDYTLLWERDLRYLKTDLRADLSAYDEHMNLSQITLPGEHMRRNAFLVQKAVERLTTVGMQAAQAGRPSDISASEVSAFPAAAKQDISIVSAERGSEADGDETGRTALTDVLQTETKDDVKKTDIMKSINTFPGTARRFEKLAANLYSDYGHHPVEIAATLQMARELSDHVVLVYQPHQNSRQHEVRSQYTDCMKLADDIYWLPTYLSREDPSLDILTPHQLAENLVNKDSVHYAELNDELWNDIAHHRETGHLVLCMGAGSIDGWVRSRLTQ